MYDPKTKQWAFVDTCFGTHHLNFGYGPSLRFSSPLIEPDVQISRIRLSDECHVKAFAGARRE